MISSSPGLVQRQREAFRPCQVNVIRLTWANSAAQSSLSMTATALFLLLGIGAHPFMGELAAVGIVSRKSVPYGVAGVAQSFPPWASMMLRQIDSPMPMPVDLVVNKGSKMRSQMASSIPVPESLTLTNTQLVPLICDSMRRMRGRSTTDAQSVRPPLE